MEKANLDLISALENIELDNIKWQKITNENLDLDYVKLLPTRVADTLFAKLEDTIEYYNGDLAKVCLLVLD